MAAQNLILTDPESNQKRPADIDEKEMFVIVCCIAKFNAFDSIGGGQSVFENVSRMSHSCLPNCVSYISESHSKPQCAVRTILPVRKGEELTIEYNHLHRMKHTHQRRQIYLTHKQFTCHCPRCDAIGDDTRQFSCADVHCKGQHMIHHPVNRNPLTLTTPNYSTLTLTDLSYDVPFTPPGFTPCTICAAVPTAHQQSRMLSMEAQLSELSQQIERDFLHLENQAVVTRTTPKLSDVLQIPDKYSSADKFPPLHSLSKHILLRLVHIADAFLPAWSIESEQYCMHAHKAYIACLEAILKFPNEQTSEALINAGCSLAGLPSSPAVIGSGAGAAGGSLFMSSNDTGFASASQSLDSKSRACHDKEVLLFAKECCEAGLRMERLLTGRRKRGGISVSSNSRTTSQNCRRATAALLAILQKLGNSSCSIGGSGSVGGSRGGGGGNTSTSGSDNTYYRGEPAGTKKASAPNAQICALCKESPNRAAIQLITCGRCGVAKYCGEECQRAHSKLHLQTECTKRSWTVLPGMLLEY